MKRKHLRGSSTAGRGSGKRTRHAGNRGGVGKAGGGKRGQQKMISFRANTHTYSYSSVKKVPLNLKDVGSLIESLKNKGKIKMDNDRYEIKLKDLGYSKVCGKFRNEKFKLAVYGKASVKAKDDILANGGEIYE
ncbi:MAG: uL15 family ribosomal protein [Candidatus Parvarchaeota archaeon]|nr:uL15 family ribosomal protein [Candidatus Parvarchaeota archaeon]MCW1294247.1 uL15 family ribosomal protein [Candidatus Parvarchaeum tengchongense]MCW1295072.1 uL15 family ribosomal protein [Candidatus Parvarchaeum tengchongense]MCW1299372.1 uL15 family ribosomal protein [Candidatus Parvarchaeum tengchongense]MCW1312653.1 uL15 family ribosomal protein [Candidatus Parvarchaeum tengchongense]